MVAKKSASAKPEAEKVIAEVGDAKLVVQTGEKDADPIQEAGERGPKSALEGGEGSRAWADENAGGKQVYSVQVHTDEKGLEVVYHPADSGDEAAQKALKSKNYKGASIRGVQPASDPDANSMGGERDAKIMIANGQNTGNIINTLGTEANAEATRELAKADVKELGE